MMATQGLSFCQFSVRSLIDEFLNVCYLGLTPTINRRVPECLLFGTDPDENGGWRGDELAPDFDGGTGEHFRDRYVARDACVGDDLQISEAGSVVEFEERKGFRVPAGPHPPGDVEVIGRLGALEHVFDQRSHGLG